MNNALLYLGGLLVATLAALFAVPHFIDWNGYRGVFEEEASKVLGRDVRVGGAVNVRFLPTPYVRFEKVRLADPTGQTGEPFVRVDSFTMLLSGPALLRGVLEANEIELQRPVLTLALDGKGGGNWANVQIKPGALPFVPQDVALHSVKLVDGSIALYDLEAHLIGKADAVNGEFSAEALKGPFKFKGQARWSGEPREIKFATTVPDAAGAFRVKASVRATKSATTYLLDGSIEDLTGIPRLTGELTGKLPLDVTDAADGAKSKDETPVLDLKSRIEANTSGAKVEDITLSLDNAAEPQLISGAATAVWGKDPRLGIVLNSKWLDLDRLTGAGQDSATFLKVKKLGLSTLRALAGDSVAKAKIDVEQIKLGGETTGGLRIDAENRSGAVRLTELKAGLPGGSRLDLSGDLKDDNGKVRFAGSGFVHGSNLARLLAWAAKSGANLDIAADGPFSAEGRLLVDDGRFELTDASADIGGRPVSGDVIVSGEGRRKVSVTIEGARLDSSELFPALSRTLDINLRRAFGLEPAAADPSTAAGGDSKVASETGDVSVRVLAGELKYGNQIFRNVDAKAGIDGGSIRIPSAKFTTANGLAVTLDGRIDNAATEPKGAIAYDFAGRTPAALNDFASITGLNSIIPAARLAATGSAKLAGLIRLGSRGPATADVSADGTVELAYVSGQAEFDGALKGWRTSPSRIRVTARAPALSPLLAAFGYEAGAAQPGAHEAELVYASTGAIASGAATVLAVSAPGFEAAYRGRLAFPPDNSAILAGAVKLKADDALDVLAVAGIGGSKGLSGITIEGDADIKRDGETWSLSSRQVIVGGSVLKGDVKVVSTGQAPSVVSADLHADQITVSGLLAAVTDKAPAEPASSGSANSGSVWPQAGFAFDALSGITGDVRLGFDSLVVEPGIAAHDGHLKLALAPGKVSMSELTGRAANGVLGGTVQLAKGPSGIALDAALRIDGADLAELGASARGKAGIEFKANGEAQSPAAIVAALSGSGTVTLDGARLPVPSAVMGVDIVAAVLGNKVANETDDIADAFRTAAAAVDTNLGSRAVPFAITGGNAKLQAISLESNSGSASGVTVVDLSTLAVDSAWRVAPMVPPAPQPADQLPGWVALPTKGPLPPASVVYTGRLADLKSFAINADASDFQRELAVRIVERNLEELERLKLQDQLRAKLELERRQAIEAERAAAKAAAAAAPAAPAANQGTATALPPVLPESAGTSPSSTTGAPSAGPTPSAGVQPSPPTQRTTITVEPDPQASAAAAAAAGAAPIVPAGERPPANANSSARPQPARTGPPRQNAPRRTSSDEVLRSLGGIP